jgi:hypothetical protein
MRASSEGEANADHAWATHSRLTRSAAWPKVRSEASFRFEQAEGASILPRPRLAYWSIFGGMMFLTMRLYAPFTPPPLLAISRPTTNTVSITVVAGGSYNYALQMSTNLTGSSWVNIRTNYSFVTPVIFTNIPATNACEFFRMVSPP